MQSNDQAITVIGQARAKGGHEADVRKGLHAFIEPARKEDGCIAYELFEDVQYTGSFYTVEKWASQEALDLHVKTQQPDMNKLLPWLSEQIRISVVRPLASSYSSKHRVPCYTQPCCRAFVSCHKRTFVLMPPSRGA